MTTYPLDQVIEELTAALRRLPALKVAVFAASCGERLNPLYNEFSEVTRWGNPADVRDGLNAAWSFLIGNGIGREAIEASLPAVLKAMPHADDFGTAQGVFAQDACYCTELALRWCIEAEDRSYAIPEYALEAIRTGESLAATGYLDLGDSAEAESFEATLLESPNVFKEIELERADLELLNSGTELTSEFVLGLRRTAERNRWLTETITTARAGPRT